MAQEPVHDAARSEKGEPAWARPLLSALSVSGRIDLSCQSVGVDPSTVFRYRQAHPEYATEFGAARHVAAEKLEDEAFRRAYDGITELISGKDGKVYENRRYSDTLLIFLLKGAMPEKYRERYDTKVSGSLDIGGAVAAAHAAAIGGVDE